MEEPRSFIEPTKIDSIYGLTRQTCITLLNVDYNIIKIFIKKDMIKNNDFS
jgi:hypothetical protein